MTISELPLLNCDMGESFGAWTMGLDAEVMPFVDCANIACGFHASDPSVMRRTVELALRHDVMIGAHPAYPDLVGFGRRSMACSSSEVRDLLQYQIGALDGICKSLGGGVRYVKPHGALYNDMMRDPALLETVMAAVAEYGGGEPPALMVLALRDNSTAGELAKRHGVSLMFEAFSDRRYSADGRLVPRSEPGAVLDSESSIVAQAEDLAAGKGVTCADGSQLLLNVDTICVHGDNAASVSAARAIRAVLDDLSGRISR